MSELAFVIAADRGTMIDEKSGEKLDWCNAHYLTDYREDDDNSAGYKPIKVGLAPEAFASIHDHGMGLYKLDFRTRPGAQNKPTLTLIKAEPVGKIDLFDLNNYRPKSGAPAMQQPQPPKVG